MLINDILLKVGTTLVLLMFILSGLGKIKEFDKVSKGLMKRFPIKLPLFFFKLSVVGVIILLLGGSLFILYSLFSNKFRKIASYIIMLLIVFTIAATLLYHFPKPKGKNIPFWSNITITGAFVLMLKSFIVDGKLF